mmetsp:Transcript_108185/g.316366  ORF Transcript_108185/g.316366 Transcript_108185/m.316366 type:complete len:203 (+) Transcript_108185:2870-3478(+)
MSVCNRPPLAMPTPPEFRRAVGVSVGISIEWRCRSFSCGKAPLGDPVSPISAVMGLRLSPCATSSTSQVEEVPDQLARGCRFEDVLLSDITGVLLSSMSLLLLDGLLLGVLAVSGAGLEPEFRRPSGGSSAVRCWVVEALDIAFGNSGMKLPDQGGMARGRRLTQYVAVDSLASPRLHCGDAQQKVSTRVPTQGARAEQTEP